MLKCILKHIFQETWWIEKKKKTKQLNSVTHKFNGIMTELFLSFRLQGYFFLINYFSFKFSLLWKWFLQTIREHWFYQIRRFVILITSTIVRTKAFSKECFKQKCSELSFKGGPSSVPNEYGHRYLRQVLQMEDIYAIN